MLIACVGVDEERVDNIGGSLALRTGSCPRFLREISRGYVFPFDRFHHLANHAVEQHHDGNSVPIGEIERLLHEIDDFLDRGRREDDQPVIAVSASARRLKIITLCRLDRT